MKVLFNQLGIWDPVPIIIFDVIYTVPTSLDDYGKVKKFSVLLTILKPQFPWFLPSQNLTPGPFYQICLETSFHYFIVIGALFSLDFFDFAKKHANFVLTVAKHLPIPCVKSPSHDFLLLIEPCEIDARGVLVPSVVNYIITPWVSYPCHFKMKWPMRKGLSRVWDKQNGSVVQLNCFEMGDTSFRVGESPWNTTDSSVQPLLYGRITPIFLWPMCTDY